ncbi:MAG: hypothetical protein Kow0031_13410 [Anaerolineae bacterium]
MVTVSPVMPDWAGLFSQRALLKSIALSLSVPVEWHQLYPEKPIFATRATRLHVDMRPNGRQRDYS